MRRHRPTYRQPQGFNPAVAAWRIVLAVAFFALYCAGRSLFGK